MKESKIEVLDSLRALAALSVCLFHFICTTTGYVTNQGVLDFFSGARHGVQMFFVISGFVIPWAMYNAGYTLRNFFSFFLKRISRLEPPYIFSILLALLILYLRVKLLGRDNSHIELSIKQVALHIGYLIPFFEGYDWLNDVYWTLAIEFQYYLLIALLFIPLIKGNFALRFLVYAGLLALAFIGTKAFLFYWLPLFLLGILLFMFRALLISAIEYYAVTAIVLLFSLWYYELSVVIYAILPLFMVIKWPGVKLPGFHFVGKFSYSLYLIHPLIGASVVNLLSHRYTQTWQMIMVFALGVGLSIFSAWVVYYFIERPSKNLSASIHYKKP